MWGINYVKRAWDQAKRRLAPPALILMYHRVTELPLDTHRLTVSPENFAQQLAYLESNCQPMRLIELVEGLATHSLPPRAVALTFDDGYYDNYSQALPLLQAAAVPATIFVVSGHVGSQRDFWWDELERIMLMPAHWTDRLTLEHNGHTHEWHTDSLTGRQAAHQAVYQLLRPLPDSERDTLLQQLFAWAGLERTGRADYRPMVTAEIEQCLASGVIDIGAHTLTHPVLPLLSPAEQREEIVSSREWLEATLGIKITTFSYPYGKFSETTAAIVEQAKLDLACTTVPGSVRYGDNHFRLKRCAIENWGIEEFSQQIENFFDNEQVIH
jgi:peptidoglycan/xylan/chitin deacetylase (PgdA/CDA1 family)